MWLRAERQNAGRGRQGRDWTSPEGNLFASTLVRLAAGEPPPSTLALVAAIALMDALRRLGMANARIKWPNDLLVDGAKLSGILLERFGEWVVIGIGVNVAAAPAVPGRAVTRIADHVDEPPSAERLLILLADEMTRWLGVWRTRGLAPVVAAWLDHAHPIGTPIATSLPDGAALQGTFGGLAEDGALILRLADGQARVIHAGDVFLM